MKMHNAVLDWLHVLTPGRLLAILMMPDAAGRAAWLQQFSDWLALPWVTTAGPGGRLHAGWLAVPSRRLLHGLLSGRIHAGHAALVRAQSHAVPG